MSPTTISIDSDKAFSAYLDETFGEDYHTSLGDVEYVVKKAFFVAGWDACVQALLTAAGKPQ